MIVQLTRFVFATVGALAGLAVRDAIDWTTQIGYQETTVIVLFVILGCAIGFIFGGIIGREISRAFLFLEDYVRRMSGGDLVLGTVGLLVGLTVALITSSPIRMLQPQWVATSGTVAMFVVMAYTGVRVAMLKRRDFAKMVPRLGEDAPAAETQKLLDTSVVIDGRFVDLLRSGFLQGRMRVPRFVLAELQTLADSADDAKRARGRRGLDQLAVLQEGPHAVEVFEADYPEVPDVDGKLVRLAADSGAELLTVDHNLAQVARVQGVTVLSINELASALRPAYLPGESIHLLVARDGKEPDQGVGYLEDGTMVVIHNGRSHVGEEIDTIVTSVLQTSGGRMIFAKPQAS
jgi:uncharacterized protein YacL